jgi:hypothetical protein
MSPKQYSAALDQMRNPKYGVVPPDTPSVTNPKTGETKTFSNTPEGNKEANAYVKALREELNQGITDPAQKVKVEKKGVGFKVTDTEGMPWYEREGVNRAKLDELLRAAAATPAPPQA